MAAFNHVIGHKCTKVSEIPYNVITDFPSIQVEGVRMTRLLYIVFVIFVSSGEI